MNGETRPESPPAIPGTKAIYRVLSLLKVFSEGRVKRSLTDLAEEVGLSKATAHRMLKILEQENFVYRSPESGEYQLGPEIIVLGSRALRAIDIREAARPELRALAESTGEDATLEVLVGTEVLILEEERGHGLLSLGTELGTRWPAHATATGKILMAFSEAEMEEPSDGLAPLTKHTIVSWDEWKGTLEEVRKKGYATNLEELEYGYQSVAAPVRDRKGRVFAAVSVGGSVHRVTRSRIPELARSVREAALRLSERSGFRPESSGVPPDSPTSD
jgi:DNA-binding IclR family transcriptional regulator